MPERYTYLAQTNPLPGAAAEREKRIQYEDERHKYWWDGEELPLSVSGFIRQYFPEFDPGACLDKYFGKWVSSSPSGKYGALIQYLRPTLSLPHTRGEIERLWRAAGKEASELGTAMHNRIEAHNNGEAVSEDSAEFQGVGGRLPSRPGAGVLQKRGLHLRRGGPLRRTNRRSVQKQDRP